jgi:hypothetical protein
MNYQLLTLNAKLLTLIFTQTIFLRNHFPTSAALIILLFFSFQLLAQVPVDSNAVHFIPTTDTTIMTNDKDIIDVARQLFRLKPSSKLDVIKPGDKPVLSFLPAVGYTLQTRFAAIVAGNIAFYTKNDPSAKLSVITPLVNYTQNEQFTIPLLSNIWLKGDQYNLIGDWRYMKYPQSTYGLGSNSQLEAEDPMNYEYIRFYQYLLKKITSTISAGLGYSLDYHWDISEQGFTDSSISDFAKYGPAVKTTSSGLAAVIMYDNRQNPINPSGGFSASLVLRDNVKWLGSNSSWQSALLDVRKYISFPRQSKNVLAFWNYDWIVLHGKPPYLDLPSNGWDNFNNTGRGFIQGRFRGNLMLYLESEYRFHITPNGLIGGVVFLNAETFSGAPSNSLETVQPGSGLGLRIKLNKKSGTNICIDYGFGTEGMKGLFVNIGEVF